MVSVVSRHLFAVFVGARMSDLAAPFLTIFEDDAMAFWCFERLLQRVSRNFRHDEVGIRCAWPLRIFPSIQKPHICHASQSGAVCQGHGIMGVAM